MNRNRRTDKSQHQRTHSCSLSDRQRNRRDTRGLCWLPAVSSRPHRVDIDWYRSAGHRRSVGRQLLSTNCQLMASFSRLWYRTLDEELISIAGEEFRAHCGDGWNGRGPRDGREAEAENGNDGPHVVRAGRGCWTLTMKRSRDRRCRVNLWTAQGAASQTMSLLASR